ncbi:hypothetical protein B0H13DRAFT_1987372 [Mycena leptocephala]|nr:hypothetical protein B0H13DRAFT_1987372 [Mycena leptocephala]
MLDHKLHLRLPHLPHRLLLRSRLHRGARAAVLRRGRHPNQPLLCVSSVSGATSGSVSASSVTAVPSSSAPSISASTSANVALEVEVRLLPLGVAMVRVLVGALAARGRRHGCCLAQPFIPAPFARATCQSSSSCFWGSLSSWGASRSLYLSVSSLPNKHFQLISRAMVFSPFLFFWWGVLIPYWEFTRRLCRT